ncbi:MarR family winged helix-turn-helix transcriptional regulator [Mesorhizobium sp. VNQ89]|uniref:MarR family winged helix-turn-helix transcriptional regulator n=1 Tax=Mesorhizobium quangtriensis TaxID=3157709 RepID=UPI0032B79881
MPKDAFFATSACNYATVRRAARKLGQFYDDIVAPSGIKATQQGLLYQIKASGEPTMGEIASAMIMDLSALGHTLKPLMRDGYVETITDKNDRRIRRVRLTKSGEKKLAEAMELWKVAQQRLEDRVGTDKAARLRAALDEIAGVDLGDSAAS